MNSPWKIWQCISDKARAKLEQYQWEHYGLKLEMLNSPVPSTGDVVVPVQVEDIEEIDRLMRMPPKSPRKMK